MVETGFLTLTTGFVAEETEDETIVYRQGVAEGIR